MDLHEACSSKHSLHSLLSSVLLIHMCLYQPPTKTLAHGGVEVSKLSSEIQDAVGSDSTQLAALQLVMNSSVVVVQVRILPTTV